MQPNQGGGSSTSQTKKMLNLQDNQHYLNYNAYRPITSMSRNSTQSKNSITSDSATTSKRNSGIDTNKFAVQTSQSNLGNKSQDASLNQRTKQQIEKLEHSLQSSGNEFFTNKPIQKNTSTHFNKSSTPNSNSFNRKVFQDEGGFSNSSSSGYITQTRNTTPLNPNKYCTGQVDKSLENSLERTHSALRQNDNGLRKKNQQNGITSNITATNQEILNKLKQLSNNANLISNQQPNQQKISSNKIANDYVRSPQNNKKQLILDQCNQFSNTSKESKTPKSQKQNNMNQFIQQQSPIHKGFEQGNERKLRSVTQNDDIYSSSNNDQQKNLNPNTKLQDMLNRMQQLTSNLKTTSNSQIINKNIPEMNLERRLTPNYQTTISSEGFTPRTDSSYSPHLQTPQGSHEPQQVQSQLKLKKQQYEDKYLAQNNYQQQQMLNSQQQIISQSQLQQQQGQYSSIVNSSLSSQSRKNSPLNSSKKQGTQNYQQQYSNAQFEQPNNPNIQIPSGIPINNNIEIEDQERQEFYEQQEQRGQYGSQNYTNINNQIQQNNQQPKSSTFYQQHKQISIGLDLCKQMQQQFNQFSSTNNKEKINHLEEANSTSCSGKSSAGNNNLSQNQLSRQNSQIATQNGADDMIKLLQEKLGDQYSYFLNQKSNELQTPRKINKPFPNSNVNNANRNPNFNPSEIIQDNDKQIRTSTPSNKQYSLSKQPIPDTFNGNQFFQQNPENQFQGDPNQLLLLKQHLLYQQQLQQQQQQYQSLQMMGNLNNINCPSASSLNMYYPQFVKQDNPQNIKNSQLLINPQIQNTNGINNQQATQQQQQQQLQQMNGSPSPPQMHLSQLDINQLQYPILPPFVMAQRQQQDQLSQQVEGIQNPVNNFQLFQQLQFLQQYNNQSDFLQQQQILKQRNLTPNDQLYPQEQCNLQLPLQNILSNSQLHNQIPQQQEEVEDSSQVIQEIDNSIPNPIHYLDKKVISQDESVSSSSSSTSTPATQKYHNKNTSSLNQIASAQEKQIDVASLLKMIKVCSRAEECIFELLQNREFEHQSHFLVKYYLLLQDLSLLEKLPVNKAYIEEIQRAINIQIILVQLIIYEHIVVIKQLRESVSGGANLNENLQNILNSFQYVHSSFILILILFEAAFQTLKSQGNPIVANVDFSVLNQTIRERTKKRKMGFLLKNQDKISILKKFNDILQPLLQILVEGQSDLKIEKSGESQFNHPSFYDDLFEIQEKISKMKIITTVKQAEKLSKDNIQIIQDEVDRLAIIKERKTLAASKDSSNEFLAHFDEESVMENQKNQSDASEASNSQNPTTSQQNKVEDQLSQSVGNDQKDSITESPKQQIDNPELQICGTVSSPYLKDISQKKYTLVLDLDETLVHYQELEDGGQFLVRPYAETFLEEMAAYYEIIIFTAGLQDYADFILDIIDVKKSISHRLYRQHTTFDQNFYVKDLSRIGRNLDKVIIIDNLPENFKFQPENGIQIQSWYGEPEDRALYELTPLLQQIVKKKFKKVQTAFCQFREKTMINISKGISDPHLNLQLEALPGDSEE